MRNITDINKLKTIISNSAVLVIFGGEHCSVCRAVRPQLDSILVDKFPDMQLVYIDCNTSPEICAQHGVYALPVIKVYIQGMLVVEEIRSFSITHLMQNIERPYTMWQESSKARDD